MTPHGPLPRAAAWRFGLSPSSEPTGGGGVRLYSAGGRFGIFPQRRYEDDPKQQATPGQAGLFFLGRKLKV